MACKAGPCQFASWEYSVDLAKVSSRRAAEGRMRMAIIVLALAAGAAQAQPRLGPVAPQTYDTAQRQAARDFLAARGQAPPG